MQGMNKMRIIGETIHVVQRAQKELNSVRNILAPAA